MQLSLFDVVKEYLSGHYGRFVSNGIEAELVGLK